MTAANDASYADQLALGLELTGPAAHAAIADLVTAGPRGLDAACGQGRHALWLAETAGPRARVTGLDITPQHLDAARRLAAIDPHGEQVEFVQGDLHALPFPDGAFDWVWCADTLIPPVFTDDPLPVVAELARVLRPGGTLGLFYWSNQSLLPGYPQLEARLNAALAETAPWLADLRPDLHFMRAGAWMAAAGLTPLAPRTYLAEIRGPLPDRPLEALSFWCRMFWGELESGVAAADWDAFRRLCLPDSDQCLLRRDDYYGFITYTLFRGVLGNETDRP